jgi:hypothetical protein
MEMVVILVWSSTLQLLLFLRTSLDGKVTVSGNEISNVKSGLYLRCKNTIAKDNILFSKCNVLPISEDPRANIKPIIIIITILYKIDQVRLYCKCLFINNNYTNEIM